MSHKYTYMRNGEVRIGCCKQHLSPESVLHRRTLDPPRFFGGSLFARKLHIEFLDCFQEGPGPYIKLFIAPSC